MDAHSFTITTAKRVVGVPCETSSLLEGGDVIKNLYDALHLIEHQAKEDGVDTSFDDWAHYNTDDENLYIWYDLKQGDKP